MNLMKQQIWSLLLFTCIVLALLVYLYGFFPIENSSNIKPNSLTEKDDMSSRPRLIDKLALIIIDALRHDFVTPSPDKNFMPFIQSSIVNNESCFIMTRAHSPTVTMPRLKALTSGMVMNYIDVVFNFMSSDFNEDNIINSAVSKGMKLVFYGDETWLKLFPKAFVRSEGTNSFFALDYSEVDDNVTRHIENEFQRTDWDIIILHYLGLDHIGHTEGPTSTWVKPKMLEMDRIVKKFYKHFKRLEEVEKLKTMLIVTGDHGMKDSGGHGGVTYSEVTVPLVSVGNPCVSLPGWPREYTPLQIDIPSTISVLLGLPPPSNSMGKMIPALLHGMRREDILKNLNENLVKLSQFKVQRNKDFAVKQLNLKLTKWLSTHNKSAEDVEKLTEQYFQYLNEISQELVQSISSFKLDYLVIGIVVMWIFLLNFVYQTIRECPKPRTVVHWLFIFGTVSHALSLASSSFIEEEHQTWYFLWITFCILLLISNLSQRLCSGLEKVCLPWVLISIAHRVLRKLNQTGDKWALLPDIKTYLNSEDKQYLLFSLFLLGMCMLFWCALKEKCAVGQLITYGMALTSVIFYRVATGSFRIQDLEIWPTSRGNLEVIFFWVFFGVFSVWAINNETPIYLTWLLLASLLVRPHNVILLPAEVLISKSINKVFSTKENLVWNTIAHIWLGNVFYFYQGNGNSLANVDVASGFVGIQTYNPVYSGVMISAHTSSAHVLAFILSPRVHAIYAVTRAIPLVFYCTVLVFQLHHLFIWSVFSPKLLYEVYATVIIFFLMVANGLHIEFKSWYEENKRNRQKVF